MPKRVYPVPEIILSDSVDIREGTGSMDNSARIMRVPLLDTPACRHVRAHEMAHAKYSPEKAIAPASIHQTVIQRVEDMRMNVHCRNQGLHEAMDAPIIEGSTMWDKLLTDELQTLTAGISTFDTGDWTDFVRHARPSEEDIEFISSLHNELSENPTWDTTIDLSQSVMEYLDAEPPPPDPDSGSGDGESDPDSDNSESGDSDADGSDGSESMTEVDLTSDKMDRIVDEAMEKEAARADMTPFEQGIEDFMEANRYLPERAKKDAKILPVKITVQKMPKRLPPSKFKSRAKVPADMGMVPKHMNRYCTDKAIFAGRGRKRSRGGTILIDASGSMSIHEKDIDDILNDCPLGTIATYSGQRDNEGDLYVIAKNGYRATENLRPPGLMNLIDVPALEWMVKQDGPYYWVCDGIVTGGSPSGYGERQGENITARCLEIVEQHGIIMVPDLTRLSELLHTGK